MVEVVYRNEHLPQVPFGFWPRNDVIIEQAILFSVSRISFIIFKVSRQQLQLPLVWG